ncbi:energy-coupling factor ABC transporter ATP-binding protein [Lyngbya sp. PCC 8106]|uniref:energy-coupling factor ABC transporter ATP-binding protein n=1 Tax=Lyngbya sp. (strain PCC 8106) TaxID=313612 RepID=UPI0000EACE70|nr:ABC transporter ATP-binding protein [Lyngbya sp. PCC 8106]EAW36111.1 cobalt transport ATP-binding protein [Lyngbya sp. PCC 8106]
MSPEFDLLSFKDVEYTYPCSQRSAVQNLTLRIPQHQRCAVIGRNGCGKTTLFRLANGLYRPKHGRIEWQGKPLKYDRKSLNQLRQQVGLVFQNPEQQLVATTVEEDISYGLCNLGLPESEIAQRVQQTLLDFDLLSLADTPINYLSLGQKKRVSIADVMVLQPQLLLLDEPTAYLDPRQVQNFRQTLEKVHSRGTTILLATHNLDFVEAWADWVFVMDSGEIVLEGTPETVFSQSQQIQELGLGVPLIVTALKAIQDELNLNQLTPLSAEQLQKIRQRIRQL